MLGIWILALFLPSTARGEEVCYERLGCFSDDKPWSGTLQRPIQKLPWAPEEIDTQHINTDSTFMSLAVIRNVNQFQIVFDVELFGFYFCFTNQRMFTVEDVNCICIDWKKGSRCQYTQASNNIRVVGAEIAYFVNVLMEKYGYSPDNVHIIGHSLGAHAAGEAGKRRPGIGRITGLDPAQPYFQDTPIEVRLDKSDAEFVDVIHTDSAPTIPYLGFGMSTAIGHLDFYPNGGEQMPGCDKNALSQIVDLDGIWQGKYVNAKEGTRDFVACNHLRSYKYYSDSIIFPDGFLGYACDSYDVFETESCFPCPEEGCPNMGHFADKFKKKNYFLWVQSGLLYFFYIGWRYKVSVTLSGNSKVTGYVNIALYGSNGNTRQYQIFEGYLKPDNTHTKLIDVEINVGTVTKVKFLWNNNWINPTLPKLGAAKVTVQSGENGEEFHFCGSETVREDVLQTLTAC
uniref:Triacylglycerol lipase n=1 Tax=Dromaius novaehollandiae TaxID=8790 RepID=A0A8C4JVT3_DRONO